MLTCLELLDQMCKKRTMSIESSYEQLTGVSCFVRVRKVSLSEGHFQWGGCETDLIRNLNNGIFQRIRMRHSSRHDQIEVQLTIEL